MLPLNQTQTPFSQSPYSPNTRNTPCTTLFVTGIDPTVGQNELVSILSSGPGFSTFRMGKDGNHCFIDYADLQSSAAAISVLNGVQLGGYKLRVDYAKKKMTGGNNGAGGMDVGMRQSF